MCEKIRKIRNLEIGDIVFIGTQKCKVIDISIVEKFNLRLKIDEDHDLTLCVDFAQIEKSCSQFSTKECRNNYYHAYDDIFKTEREGLFFTSFVEMESYMLKKSIENMLLEKDVTKMSYKFSEISKELEQVINYLKK